MKSMPKRGTRLGSFLWPQVISRLSRHFLWQARQHWKSRNPPELRSSCSPGLLGGLFLFPLYQSPFLGHEGAVLGNWQCTHALKNVPGVRRKTTKLYRGGFHPLRPPVG